MLPGAFDPGGPGWLIPWMMAVAALAAVRVLRAARSADRSGGLLSSRSDVTFVALQQAQPVGELGGRGCGRALRLDEP